MWTIDDTFRVTKNEKDDGGGGGGGLAQLFNQSEISGDEAI